ncbi:MAG: aldehyde dehydrogenase family protein, partial [Ilumatobacteraceae bacterium]
MTLPTQNSLTDLADAALRACGAPGFTSSGQHMARSPITGTTLAAVDGATSVDDAAARASTAFA